MGRRKIQIDGFVVLIIFITGLLVVSLINPYVNIITLLLCVCIVFKKNDEDALCMLLYVFSFERIFKLQMGGFALVNVVQLALLFKLLWSSNFRIPKRNSIPLIIFAIYITLISISTGLANCVAVVMSLLLALMILQKNEGRFSIIRLVEYTTLGLVTSSALALFRSVFPRLNVVLSSTRIRLGKGAYYYRFSGLQTNPNYYTVLISLVLAIFAVLYINKKLKKQHLAYVIALLVFGLMSASMSFVVSLVAIAGLLMLSLSAQNGKRFLIGILVLLGVVVLIYALRNTTFVSTILYRLQTYSAEDEVSVSTLTTGRSDIWGRYIEYFMAYPLRLLFGSGVGASTSAIIGNEAHNYFIEVLFYTGLCGLGLYVWAMLRIFDPRRRCRNRVKFMSLIPFGILLLRGMARCLFADEMIAFMFALCTITAVAVTEDVCAGK